MTTIQNARPETQLRADGLSRMLELENIYKMQRLQDTGSTSPLTPSGLAHTRSAFSAQPNTAVKSRRASAHPPVTHDHPHMMMMKATRRSSGLPSLSISASPSLTSVVAVRADGVDTKSQGSAPSTGPATAIGERRKTVAFSKPTGESLEEDGLSDQSSICHSPSWAVYGQKKKNKKREAAKKKKEQESLDKVGKDLTKKRLTKAPPQANPGPRFLSVPDRSFSAPDLEQHQTLGERVLNRSTSHYPPDSMTNIHNLLKSPPPNENSKTQSKGLFSGFRRSRSSSITSTTQKAETNGRINMDDTHSVRGGSAFGLQVLGTRGDMDFLNPRKPPSIRSSQSSSTQSQSSQEQQTRNARKSPNHGRSLSFLARLKGPSYLYSKSSESAEEVLPQHSGSSGQIDSTVERLVQSQLSYHAVSVPDSPRDVGRGQDKNPRGRQAQVHVPQTRDPSSGYEDTDAADSRRPYIEQRTPDVPVANEGRRRPPTKLQQTRFQHQDSMTPVTLPQLHDGSAYHDDQLQDMRRKPSVSQAPKAVASQMAVLNPPTPSTMSPSSDGGYAAAYTDAIEQLSESHSPRAQVVRATQLSNSRPRSSQEKANTTGTDNGRLDTIVPPLPGHNVGSLPYCTATKKSMTEMRTSPGSVGSAVGQIKSNLEDQTIQQVLVPTRSADYFTFISEPYAPPSLELHSPIENEHQASQSMEYELNEGELEDYEPTWTAFSTQGLEHENRCESRSMDRTENESVEDMTALEFCDSPTLSARHADDHAPVFDHPEVSPSSEKNLLKTPTFGTQLQMELRRSISERSSSTCNDTFDSPSTATTPNASIPQSERGTSVEVPRVVPSVMKQGEEKASRRPCRSKIMGLSESRSSSRDTSLEDVTCIAKSLGDNDHQTTISTSVTSDENVPGPMPESPTKPLGEDTTEDVAPVPIRPHLTPKAQSALDLTSTDTLLSGKDQPQSSKENKMAFSSFSLPNSPPPELELEVPTHRRSALKMPRTSSSISQESLNVPLAGAAYLQEARKTAPIPPTSTRALRSAQSSRHSLPHLRSSQSPVGRGEAMAKVLVQCCNCHFFHDMPSKVYECMAKPDAIVEDLRLGVSAAITTTVRCPWCAHGMTTECCAGYAAMVYLKEKLHGK